MVLRCSGGRQSPALVENCSPVESEVLQRPIRESEGPLEPKRARCQGQIGHCGGQGDLQGHAGLTEVAGLADAQLFQTSDAVFDDHSSSVLASEALRSLLTTQLVEDGGPIRHRDRSGAALRRRALGAQLAGRTRLAGEDVPPAIVTEPVDAR